MDYRLDVYIKKDDERAIRYRTLRTVYKPRGIFNVLAPDDSEEIVETHEFVPLSFVMTLTPYHNIIAKLKSKLELNTAKSPQFVEYETINVPKQAVLIAQTPERSIIKYTESEEEDVLQGMIPSMDMDAVRKYAAQAIETFKINNDVNIITPGAGLLEIWKSPEDYQKALR